MQRRDSGRGALRRRREGHHGDQAPLSRPHRIALGRERALREGLLGSGYRAFTRLATRRTSTRTVTSGSADARTRSSRSPATASARSRSRPCLRHASVAEAGVTGRPDELRGEVISAFVVLKQGHVPTQASLHKRSGPRVPLGHHPARSRFEGRTFGHEIRLGRKRACKLSSSAAQSHYQYSAQDRETGRWERQDHAAGLEGSSRCGRDPRGHHDNRRMKARSS